MAFTVEQRAAHRQEARVVEIGRPRKPKRRSACRLSLINFCKQYHAESFVGEFSEDHVTYIDALQDSILNGGLVAIAMPRGHGKTTIAEVAAEWAILYGHRRYVMLIAASEVKAQTLLRDIKTWLRFNETLLEDFPEACAPIVAIEGVAIRARAQTSVVLDAKGVRKGSPKPTTIEWLGKKIVLPTVEKSPSSGAVIEVAGITGDIRGRKHTLPAGESIRPDFCIIDDPQTAESANSDAQCRDREAIIRGDVLGLAGPGKTIAAVIPCTIIRDGDLAARLLDRNLNPDFRGLTASLIRKMPTNSKLWDQYNEIRKDGLRSGETGAALQFYADNREAMDEGAEVSWEWRKSDSDISAIQHAMDLRFKLGEEAFAAEYQNSPISRVNTLFRLDEDRILGNINGLGRGQLPEAAKFLTCFIDINRYGLHWGLAGFSNAMAGWIIDYGKFPEGDSVIWHEGDQLQTEEQAIYRALHDLLRAIAERPWPRKIDVVGVDCGYKMETVFNFAKSWTGPFRLVPSRGWGSKYYKPGNVVGKPFTECHIADWQKKGRVLVHNADYWREQQQRAWLIPVGADGSLSLYGDDQRKHRNFAEQVSSEVLIDKAHGNYGWLYKWSTLPGRRNDLGDVATGLRVLAHVLGADQVNGMGGKQEKPVERRKRVSYTEV